MGAGHAILFDSTFIMGVYSWLETVSDGEEAFEKRKTFSAEISDVRMPKMDGLALLGGSLLIEYPILLELGDEEQSGGGNQEKCNFSDTQQVCTTRRNPLFLWG